MRKLLFFTILSAILIAGCNPNEELYEELDKYVEPYNEEIEVTLESNDYEDIAYLARRNAQTLEDTNKANAVENYESFSDTRPAADFIPYYLSDNYMALNEGSSANVTYNFYRGEPVYLSKIGGANVDTVKNADYDSLGVGDNYFSSDNAPEDYISDFLSDKYPLAPIGNTREVVYRYLDNVYNTLSMTSGYYYLTDEGWEAIPEVYKMQPSDYASIEALQNHHYFNETYTADDFMPKFLETRFPYADEGTEKVMVYNFVEDGSNDTLIYSMQYKLENGTWGEYNETIPKTSQFIHTGEKWVFDPTVRFEMVSTDYQLIVDERETKFVDSYGTGEFYSGANSYYGNFDTRILKRFDYEPETFEGLEDAEAMKIIWERILKQPDEPMETRGALIVMLQKKFPNAQPTSNGVPVFYEVTFETFNNDFSRSTYTAKYQCTAAGSPAQFEYIESDTPYESE